MNTVVLTSLVLYLEVRIWNICDAAMVGFLQIGMQENDPMGSCWISLTFLIFTGWRSSSYSSSFRGRLCNVRCGPLSVAQMLSDEPALSLLVVFIGTRFAVVAFLFISTMQSLLENVVPGELECLKTIIQEIPALNTEIDGVDKN